MRDYPEKCHSDEARPEMALVERGKPCKRATQTLVGASGPEKMNLRSDHFGEDR